MAAVEEERTATDAATSARASSLALWAVAAAFGTYFCMYVFRKPFTAATFSGGQVFGLSEKTVLVTAQVLGYMASKVVGIRVIAETPRDRRAVGILVLIGTAEAGLLLFGLAPSPWHVACLFLNGFALGMVFGFVLGFLEGRRNTEALTAGLCASFILADGVAKSVGAWLLDAGVTERWMPAAAGGLFFPPLLLFVWMLTRIPPPDDHDIAHRGVRETMTQKDRTTILVRHGWGLGFIFLTYLLVSIARSVRADYAPEIWRALGSPAAPALFSQSEIVVALAVLVVNGLSVLIVDNRRAFLLALGVAGSGGLLMLAAILGQNQGWLGPFGFMVLLGTGLYLPYVAIHTTVFERLIAMTRDRGNIGFLMYVADSVGYLGYAGLLIARNWLPAGNDFLRFFLVTTGVVAILVCVCQALAWARFVAPSRANTEGAAA